MNTPDPRITRLVLTTEQRRQIEQQGVAAFPDECCGAMVGSDEPAGKNTRRIVHRLVPMSNAYDAQERFHRFSINPRELIQIEKSAAADGLVVLGFYHSHPDHPARPSETDRLNAWPFYSYLIVSILQRRPDVMTSWQLDAATEQFGQEPIDILDATCV